MADFDFNGFMGKVTDFAVGAAGKAKNIANLTADQAKRVARMAKLNVEISNEKENVKKSYVELGRLYYETHKDSPEGFFVQLCEEVTASNTLIAEKEAELAELKAKVSEGDEPASDPDFETVVAETEAAAEVSDEEAPAEEAPAEEAPAEDKPEE